MNKTFAVLGAIAVLALFAFVAVWLSAPSVAPPVSQDIPVEAVEATVDYVHDGDTLFVNLDGERVKVRLIGIDTPEVGDNFECYGDEATALARSLMPSGSTVWALADGGTHDRYGRSLFYLFTDEGTLVNVELVARGAAETLLISDNDRYWPELEAAERVAREGGVGVWGACS